MIIFGVFLYAPLAEGAKKLMSFNATYTTYFKQMFQYEYN